MKKIIAAIIMIILVTGCITQDKCYKRFPPQVKDSISYVEKWRDSIVKIPGDTSLSSYLIECEKTAEGYKTRIIQLLTQKPGEYLNTPVSTVQGNVLTTVVNSAPRDVHVQIRYIELKAVKAQVYVKITNELKGWQMFLMWVGGICMLFILIAIIVYIALKIKWKPFIFILFFIPVIGLSQTTGTYWRVATKNTPFTRDLIDSTLVYVRDTALWFELTAGATKTQCMHDIYNSGEYRNVSHLKPADTLWGNSYLFFKNGYGSVNSYSTTAPLTNYSILGLTGASGTAQLGVSKQAISPAGLSGASITAQSSPSWITLQLSRNDYGYASYTFSHQGVYPSSYSTLDAYNQFVGHPGNEWNDGYFKKLHLTELSTGSVTDKKVVITSTGEVKQIAALPNDTTGLGLVVNVGIIIYNAGSSHFYGLKSGTPPAWVQLD